MTPVEAKLRSILVPEMLATDIAEYLVRKGLPFRETHHIAGIINYQSHSILEQIVLQETFEMCEKHPFNPELVNFEKMFYLAFKMIPISSHDEIKDGEKSRIQITTPQ